jgi:hypothetical protein
MPASKQVTVSSTPRRVDIPGTIDMIDLSTMGGRITWARIRKELRQEDVAEKLGKSPGDGRPIREEQHHAADPRGRASGNYAGRQP